MKIVLATQATFLYNSRMVLTKEGPETKESWIQLRCEAHYYRAQHTRALERERALKAKVQELAATLDLQAVHLRELTAGFQKAAAEQAGRIEKLTQRVENLTTQNTWLKQRLFGRQSERGDDAPACPGFGMAEGASVAATQTKRPKGQQAGTAGHGRKKHENLPSIEVFHDLKERDKLCPICGQAFMAFPTTADSEDIHYEVRVTRRIHKRKCYTPTCHCGVVTGIVAAPPVPKLIPKGMFSVELWVHILAEKFLFQRPLWRTLQTLALEGLRVSQGTVTGGLRKIGEIVHPLYARILERNRAADHWHMDETRWLVFAAVTGKTGYRWWLWVSVTRDTVAYLLDPSRSSSVPKEHLGEDPSGTLSVDRYAAYKALGSEKLKVSFCWAHVRRDYTRIHDAYPKLRVWAQGWIDRINQLFHINNRRRGVLGDKEMFQSVDSALRKEIGCFKDACVSELASQDLHPTARKALASVQRHWDGLVIFVDHPEIPMDNNLSERKLREAALGRKNYYGSGAVWSGDLTAALFTVFQTARHNGLDPLKYLTAYLRAAADCGGKPPSSMDEFLPWKLSEEQKASWALPP